MNTFDDSLQPRPGAAGWIDRIAGPGATQAELALQFGAAGFAALLAPLYAAAVVGAGSPWWKYALCAVLAFDVVGGIVTSATVSGHRWFHRAQRTRGDHVLFAALHGVHLAVVWGVYLNHAALWLPITFAMLLVGTAAIVWTPPYMQRPVSLLVYAVAVWVVAALPAWPAGMSWFLPLFYLKLFVAYLPCPPPRDVPADALR